MSEPFTLAELEVIRAALTTPTCWRPATREAALELVVRAEAEQLVLLAEAGG